MSQSRPAKPACPSRVVQICEFIDSIPLFDPKNFVQLFLDSPDSTLASHCRLWATATGWSSTTRLMRSIKRFAKSTAAGTALWESFISDKVESIGTYLIFDRCPNISIFTMSICFHQAEQIVISQSMPSGKAPDGSFYSSKEIDHTFFEKDNEEERERKVRQYMPFLYNLIQAKIKDTQLQRNSRRDSDVQLKQKQSETNPRIEEDDDSDCDSGLTPETNKDGENIDRTSDDPAALLDMRDDVSYHWETEREIQDQFHRK
ncbi:uncharacterized protein MELLADRAFT_65690 [Melampsora larici-populina 98AG31]|uniref:Uncharacterized protein n=1 Tax=Melampsora larici-populina (strain 98AG31 / pathotype 3-4-7) TaxID=747676 RepID=F4RWD1_MELLP|nr:uncharacterized protein MELLADRAFT_65690 [Melampsora larici-populina 98AG31]EGG03344.1 hypothetical protein MELLADRAFT_65690 [Melampsora larici-populina 98AG31]